MNKTLKRIAFFIGMGILGISIYWSKNGFNFSVAGDSGNSTEAIIIGWFLAIAVTALQFIFSSNFRELNSSLVLLGLTAYAYSIFTNYQGILEFQGAEPNRTWAIILSVILDATAEPMIAWSLGVSREGDMIGNIVKAFKASLNSMFEGIDNSDRSRTNTGNKVSKPNFPNREPSFHEDSSGIPDFMKHLDKTKSNAGKNKNRYHLS